MARHPRISEPGTYHHITARGVNRCPIFQDDGDRRQFLALLRESHQRFGCRVLAFCLMDNHIHLTLLDDHVTLSKTLHFLNGVYAKRFNLRHGRTGHLFERRFWSSMLASDAYLVTCVKYVHRNPYEAGMVRTIEEHRWSSYPSYIGERTAPSFLDTTAILEHFGNDRLRLRAATEMRTEDSIILRQLSSSNPPSVLGKSDLEASKVAERVHTGPLVPLDLVLITCAEAAHVPVEEIMRSTPGRRNDARSLAAFVAHRHAGHTLRDIAKALDLGSIQAASALCQRFSVRRDEATEEVVKGVVRSLRLMRPTC